MTLKPSEYEKAVIVVEEFLKQGEWDVFHWGIENRSRYCVDFANRMYDITGLYLRTLPDLFVYRFPKERWLIECKAHTATGTRTGNYSLEAFPWFVYRHLLKMGINICYAIPDPSYGIRFFRPDYPPFSRIRQVTVPTLHRKLFREKVAARWRQGFNFGKEIQFIYDDPKADSRSDDPFLLMPASYLSEAELGEYFRETGQVRNRVATIYVQAPKGRDTH